MFNPIANPAAIVTAPQVRFTVLTSRLLRLEYSPIDHFEDRASQVFWYRASPCRHSRSNAPPIGW